jgi:hypothetical protein
LIVASPVAGAERSGEAIPLIVVPPAAGAERRFRTAAGGMTSRFAVIRLNLIML